MTSGRDSTVLVVVPARGGSTRIPRKNVVPLGGMPLLHWTLLAVREAGLLDATVVSTDDPEIADTAREMNVTVVPRPAELSGPSASTESALRHALDAVAADGRRPEWIVTLPPTSPFRSAATINAVLERAAELGDTVDCVMSVTETRDDFWRQAEDGSLSRLFPDAPRRQQDRAPLFIENSAVYATRVAALARGGTVLGDRVVGLPIGPIEALDINVPTDLALAEAVIAAGLVAGHAAAPAGLPEGSVS